MNATITGVPASSLRAADGTTAVPLVQRVSIENVNKFYGTHHALSDINLSVSPNEVVVLLGPSGAGKSTLCRTVNRLERIDSGVIRVDGESLPEDGRQLAAARQRIGMVFQSFNLFLHMTILQNVMVGPVKVLGLPKAEVRERAMALLKRVRIADQADKYPSQLSGGQQQRAAIARSLAMNPKVLLFDEPTSALDPEMIKEVVDVMTDLAAEGMTMIVVTHEVGFAKQCADRCVFMADGKIVEMACPEEFFSAPKSDRAREFIATILH